MSRKVKVQFDEKFYTEYSKDIIEYMLEQEKYRERFEGSAKQLMYRVHLVDLMKKVCLRREFMRSTLHLAVYLMDLYLEYHDIAQEQLNKVAIVVLMIAAKFEETETTVPKYSDIHTFITLDYTKKDYVETELQMLQFFEWNLNIPTATTFLDLYIEDIVTLEDFEIYKDDPMYNHISTFSDFKSSVISVVFQILDISLLDIVFLDDKPSELAAASIAAARYFFKLPFWNDTLSQITEYEEETIINLVFYLVAIRNKTCLREETDNMRQDSSENCPDSGYLSHRSETEYDMDFDENDETERFSTKRKLEFDNDDDEEDEIEEGPFAI